jgi:hypothetical protein
MGKRLVGCSLQGDCKTVAAVYQTFDPDIRLEG